jgi:magnesium transporter
LNTSDTTNLVPEKGEKPPKTKRYKRHNLLTSPGTLVYIGPETELKTRIKKIQYNEKVFTESAVKSLIECVPGERSEGLITWLNVDGIHQTSLIEKLGTLYELHPLLLEDVVNTEHKPKIELYDSGHLFVTLKMLHIDSELPLSISAEHVSFVLGHNYLISFQEELSDDIFTSVLARLKASVGKTRKNGADYLMFALMDVVIDNYFIILEKLGDQLDLAEDQVIRGSKHFTLADLYALKREITLVRRFIWPVRDIINQLIREDNPLVSKKSVPYYRDLYDHVVQMIDTIDSYRELLASLADVHLSTMSNRMNAVMKTLTIFSAIFMPLTFIVGVYGMNFDNMPELHFHYGYFYTWALMLLVTVGMVFYFKWRRWF